MARIKKGINGGFSGKVGKVVGGSWNGIDYIRSLPAVKGKRTDAQLKNEYIFGVAQAWLNPIKEFLDIGFKGYSRTVYGINAAKSVMYKTSLIKDGYNTTVDSTLAVVSHGDLGQADFMQAELNEDKGLVFTWDPSTGEDKGAYDKLIMLAHNPEGKTAKYELRGAYRKTGTDSLDLSLVDKGTYHIYAAFVAEDLSRQSMSEYLGAVQV